MILLQQDTEDDDPSVLSMGSRTSIGSRALLVPTGPMSAKKLCLQLAEEEELKADLKESRHLGRKTDPIARTILPLDRAAETHCNSMPTTHSFLQSSGRLTPMFTASGIAYSIFPFFANSGNAHNNVTDCDNQPEDSSGSAKPNSPINSSPSFQVPNILPLSIASPEEPTSILEPKHPQEGCEACLYTGIATCTGLSFYFAKIALLEIPDITKKMKQEVAKGHRRNRAGFLVVSAFWVAAGAYRWHLG